MRRTRLFGAAAFRVSDEECNKWRLLSLVPSSLHPTSRKTTMIRYPILFYDVKHGHGDGEEGLACLGEAIHENVRAVAVPRGGGAPSRLCRTIHSSWTLRFSTIDSFRCDLKETVIVMGLQRRWRFGMRCIHRGFSH